MAKKLGRIEESQISRVVLKILEAQPHGRATVRTIRKQVPAYVHLSASDQAGSMTRNLEKLWEQQVRNLKSHWMVPGNVFAEGYVRWVRRGLWELTPSGLAKAKTI